MAEVDSAMGRLAGSSINRDTKEMVDAVDDIRAEIAAAYARGAREMRTQAISTAHKLGATRTADAIRALPDTPAPEAGEQS